MKEAKADTAGLHRLNPANRRSEIYTVAAMPDIDAAPCASEVSQLPGGRVSKK
jgi:hypothetical protein